MTVGERIKQRRMELGLTQEELAIRMGYKGKTAVCMAETRGDNVTTTKVAKFAKALDVTPRWLMGFEDPDDHAEDVVDYLVNTREGKEFIELYQGATPAIRNAVLTLLKSSKQDS